MSRFSVNRKIMENYFVFSDEEATCKLCLHKLKADRTFNLKNHVIKVHKIKEDEIKKDSDITETISSVIAKKNRKQSIKIEISKKQLFRSYIGLVTEDNIPFNIYNSENLKNIVNPICRGLSKKFGKKFFLNGNNCKKVLQLVVDNIRTEIKSDLKLRLLSLKIDSATRLSRNVFSISAQFIKNSEIQSRILGIVELKGAVSSCSKNFATEILNILSKYDVNLNQIVSITSDSGTNIIKTTKILSHCNIFEEGHEGGDLDDGNDNYLRNIQMLKNSSEVNLGDIQICRCAAHIAQLCALDIAKDTVIKNVLLSCRNLVKFIKKPSNGYLEIFELKCLTVPQLDCPTRWGSTYNMIKSLKSAREILVNIETIENKSLDENFDISDNFWNFIEAYYIAFAPLQKTLIKFQAEQLHYGNFYAEWLKCKLCTEKILENADNVYVKQISRSLLRNMENRIKQLLNNESLISCLYLDPRFHHTLTTAQKLEATTYLKKLYEKIQNINKSSQEIKIESPSSSQLESIKFSKKADEYLNEYLTQKLVSTTNEVGDVYSKIDNLQLPFVRVDTNILHFWREKQYSNSELYALSNICFAIPTTQVTIERPFSSLKFILTDNHINNETLENILLVKLNATYLDRAMEDLQLFKDDI